MTTELPLFPLHTVFFPRMLMPLHIFEDRYKVMIEYCMRHSRPFGIVLIRSGHEVGGPAEPFDIGTRAEILRVIEMEDHTKHIIVRGLDRFIIRGLRETEPYLVGEVEEFPLITEGVDEALLARVEIRFYRYLRLLKEAQGLSITINKLPEDAEGVAWMVAWGLQVDLAERQGLLSLPRLQDILLKEEALLRKEVEILQMLTLEQVKRRMPPAEMGYLSFN